MLNICFLTLVDSRALPVVLSVLFHSEQISSSSVPGITQLCTLGMISFLESQSVPSPVRTPFHSPSGSLKCPLDLFGSEGELVKLECSWARYSLTMNHLQLKNNGLK